jgi:hypothetical protein
VCTPSCEAAHYLLSLQACGWTIMHAY